MRRLHYSAMRGIAIACRLSVTLVDHWIMTTHDGNPEN